MMKPLLITDCDEVLLHMVRHFGAWLGEHHAIDLRMDEPSFETAMRHREDGDLVTRETMWSMVDGFFPAEMERQTLVPHADKALAAIAERADIVILTNLRDHCRESRIAQLSTHGIEHRVECNQGPKGAAVARLVAEHGNPVTVFVDDLPSHHQSVAEHVPGVHRLHMIAEPQLAPHVAPAPAAHARIDDWREAAAWIGARFDAGVQAEA
jgi:hypothetical protein